MIFLPAQILHRFHRGHWPGAWQKLLFITAYVWAKANTLSIFCGLAFIKESFWLTSQQCSCPFKGKKRPHYDSCVTLAERGSRVSLWLDLLTQLHCQCLLASHLPFLLLIHPPISGKFCRVLKGSEVWYSHTFTESEHFERRERSISVPNEGKTKQCCVSVFPRVAVHEEYWPAHYSVGQGTYYQYMFCLILVKQEIRGSCELGVFGTWLTEGS